MTPAAFQSGRQDRWLAADSDGTEAVKNAGGRRVRTHHIPDRLENEFFEKPVTRLLAAWKAPIGIQTVTVRDYIHRAYFSPSRDQGKFSTRELRGIQFRHGLPGNTRVSSGRQNL